MRLWSHHYWLLRSLNWLWTQEGNEFPMPTVAFKVSSVPNSLLQIIFSCFTLSVCVPVKIHSPPFHTWCFTVLSLLGIPSLPSLQYDQILLRIHSFIWMQRPKCNSYTHQELLSTPVPGQHSHSMQLPCRCTHRHSHSHTGQSRGDSWSQSGLGVNNWHSESRFEKTMTAWPISHPRLMPECVHMCANVCLSLLFCLPTISMTCYLFPDVLSWSNLSFPWIPIEFHSYNTDHSLFDLFVCRKPSCHHSFKQDLKELEGTGEPKKRGRCPWWN